MGNLSVLDWTLIFAIIGALLLFIYNRRRQPRRMGIPASSNAVHPDEGRDKVEVVVWFGSQTGTAARFAKMMCQEILDRLLRVQNDHEHSVSVRGLEEFTPSSFTLSSSRVHLFIVATYGDGEPTDNAVRFKEYLESSPVSSLPPFQYAIFGLGDRTYGDHFNRWALQLDQQQWRIGGEAILPVRLGDASSLLAHSLEDEFEGWKEEVLLKLSHIYGLRLKERYKYVCK